MKKIYTLGLILLLCASLFAQRDLERELKGYRNPDELVSFSANLDFKQAIEILSRVSEKSTGQRIVSTVEVNAPIGVDLAQIHYRKALTIIVQYQNLLYEEKPEVIVIKGKAKEAEVDPKKFADFDSREVKISALFFEADESEMRERGINWQFLLSKNGLSIGSDFISTVADNQNSSGSGTATQNIQPSFSSSVGSSFEMGDFKGNAVALFRFFESENLGQIIANPSISVRDKEKGRIQIGSDFSIKQKDFAGNVIEQFFSTGSIIEAVPYVFHKDGIDYILLKLKLERSSALPGELSTEIRKTVAETDILMLPGEETAIGGLFINDEIKVRSGIPFLKDLPWWVLGIRYLTGSDEIQVRRKEVIILVKTELLPSLQERFEMKNPDVFKQKKEEHQQNFERIRTEAEKGKNGDGTDEESEE